MSSSRSTNGKLRTSSPPADGVSRTRRVNFRDLSRLFHGLRPDCVSREGNEDFRCFLHNYSHLQPDCVSHDRPSKSGRRITIEGASWPRVVADDSVAKTAITVVVRVRFVPPSARPTVSLGLARSRAAHLLPSTSSWLRREPLPTDPTRTLTPHRRPPLRAAERPTRSGRRELLGDRRPRRRPTWVDSHEQSRVISRER